MWGRLGKLGKGLKDFTQEIVKPQDEDEEEEENYESKPPKVAQEIQIEDDDQEVLDNNNVVVLKEKEDQIKNLKMMIETMKQIDIVDSKKMDDSFSKVEKILQGKEFLVSEIEQISESEEENKTAQVKEKVQSYVDELEKEITEIKQTTSNVIKQSNGETTQIKLLLKQENMWDDNASIEENLKALINTTKNLVSESHEFKSGISNLFSEFNFKTYKEISNSFQYLKSALHYYVSTISLLKNGLQTQLPSIDDVDNEKHKNYDKELVMEYFKKIKTSYEQTETHDKEVTQLTKQLASLTQKYEYDIVEMKEKIDDLSDENNKKGSFLNSLQEELKMKTQELINTKQRSIEEINSLTTDLSKSQNENKQLNEAKENLQKTIKKLELDLNMQNMNNQSSENQINEYKKKIEENEESIIKLEELLEQVNNENEEERENFISQMDKMKDEVEQIKKKNEELTLETQEYIKMKDTYEKISLKSQQLQQQYTNEKFTNKEMNILMEDLISRINESNLVDRRVIFKLLVSYIQQYSVSNEKLSIQMFNLLSNELRLNPEEKKQLENSIENIKYRYKWFGKIETPELLFEDLSSPRKKETSNLSLSELWVKYLLENSSSASKKDEEEDSSSGIIDDVTK